MEFIMSNKSKGPTLAQQSLITQREKADEFVKKSENTEAGAIWNEIKDRDIMMFALPGQKVWMHCHPLPVEPNRLYLTTNSSAVLPSLEAAIGMNYTVELANKFVIVARANVETSPFKK